MVKIVNGNIDVIGSSIGYCTCRGWWASTQQTSVLVGVSVNRYGYIVVPESSFWNNRNIVSPH